MAYLLQVEDHHDGGRPPPTTMNGFLTRSLSEMIPQRITAMTLNPHIQLPSALAL